MNVRLKKSEAPKYQDLTQGNLYRVLGIEADDFRIISDEGRPYLFPSDDFEVVDSTEPSDWVVSSGAEGEHYAYPPEFSGAGFFEDFFDGEPGAVAIFRAYLSRLLRSAKDAAAAPTQSSLGAEKRWVAARDLQIVVGEDGEHVAYVRLPGHPGTQPGVVKRAVSLRDLVGEYVGPDVHLDFAENNVLIGIEIVG